MPIVLHQGADRILALGGDHVKSTGSAVLVNGMPCSSHPLNNINPPQFELDVPAGSCLIWPSTVNLPMDVGWENAVLVPLTNVEGCVFFQTAPFSQWGRVR